MSRPWTPPSIVAWADRAFTYWEDDPDDPEYEVEVQSLPWVWAGGRYVLFNPKRKPTQRRKMPRGVWARAQVEIEDRKRRESGAQ